MSYGYNVSRDELQRFKSTWPCSGITDRVWSIGFDWDSNGDLVDVRAKARNGRQLGPDDYDGPAVVALSLDCQAKMHREHAIVRGWNN